jgi:hypothetical protein
MYDVRVYDEDGDEIQVFEVDVKDSGDPTMALLHVYVSYRDSE